MRRLSSVLAPSEVAANAQATLSDGELCVTIPRIPDRRGRSMRVPVRLATGSA